LEAEFDPNQRYFILEEYLNRKILSGRGEEAWLLLQSLFEDEESRQIGDLPPQLAHQFRELRYLAALHVGRYQEALEYLEELIRPFEQVPTNPADRFRLVGALPAVTGAVPMAFLQNQFVQLDRFLREYSRLQLYRGLIAVEAGEMGTAAASFPKARRPFGLGVATPTVDLAAEYGRAIDRDADGEVGGDAGEGD
jgi:hypothetical protein